MILLELKRNSETELIVRVLKEDQNTQKVKHSFFFLVGQYKKKKKKRRNFEENSLFQPTIIILHKQTMRNEATFWPHKLNPTGWNDSLSL